MLQLYFHRRSLSCIFSRSCPISSWNRNNSRRLDTILWLPKREEFTVTDPRIDCYRILYRSVQKDKVFFEYAIVYQNPVRFFPITKCFLLIEFASDGRYYFLHETPATLVDPLGYYWAVRSTEKPGPIVDMTDEDTPIVHSILEK